VARRRPVELVELEGDLELVAPRLLNKLLVVGKRVGRVVEVEGYRGRDDPASHAFGGQTARNATMFGPPGRLYVYFTYGMHFCANVVLGPEGDASAALLRALAPLEGLDEMRLARPRARNDRDLCNGPAKLCQALGIDRRYDGADLRSGHQGVRLMEDGRPPPEQPAVGRRIGIRVGQETPWRWWVPGDPHVSGPRALV
jgi:DNA-3-methyladenine glycosylase